MVLEMSKKQKRIKSVPSHLALIPDGNRRWSSMHKLSILKGYDMGVKKFIDFSLWAKNFGVKTITVWALSTENIKNRSRFELRTLYNLYIRAATDKKLLADLQKNGVRVQIIGNLDMLPKRVIDMLRSVEAETKAYKDFTINLLIGYGGRDDILHAFRGLYNRTLNRLSLSESVVKGHMRTASIPDVDLIIRTSGEMRLSGFLPWQSDYSELYFTKKYWPDFKREDLRRALEEFSERKRRYGK